MFANSNIKTRALKLTGLLIFFPFILFGQKLTGLWTGTIANDSSTIRKEQSFEIALTEYRGKVYGYSQNEFIINDTLYYIVKRVKGTINGDICEVKDDEILSYNFRGKLDKGVKVIWTFRMNKQDSTWSLDANWKTTKTKKFYSLTGKAALNEEKDLSKSKLFPHLEEMNMANDVVFYKEQKRANVSVKQNQSNKKTEIALATIDKTKKEEETSVPFATKNDVKSNNSVTVSSKPDDQSKKNEAIIIQPLMEPKKNESLTAVNISNEKRVVVEESKKREPKKPEQAVTIISPEIKKTDLSEKTKIVAANKPELSITPPAAFVSERKTELPQTINFKSDSLELVLYDNGEIDGDTVSVLMNNEVIIAKQCLKASAFKKIVYIPQSNDSTVIVLYAENLGKYPPNTGLLIIHDGEDSYQVRFTADLQTNAAVVLRRKKQ